MMAHPIAPSFEVPVQGPRTERRASSPSADFGPAIDDAIGSLRSSNSTNEDQGHDPIRGDDSARGSDDRSAPGEHASAEADDSTDAEPSTGAGAVNTTNAESPPVAHQFPTPSAALVTVDPDAAHVALDDPVEIEGVSTSPDHEATSADLALDQSIRRPVEVGGRSAPTIDPSVLEALDTTAPVARVGTALDNELGQGLVDPEGESLEQLQLDEPQAVAVEGVTDQPTDGTGDTLDLGTAGRTGVSQRAGTAESATPEPDPTAAGNEQVSHEPAVGGVEQTQSAPARRGDDAVVPSTSRVDPAVDATKAADSVGSPSPADTALDAETETALWEQVQRALGRVRASVDGQDVRLRLKPADLGELLVRVNTMGDQVNVRLVVSSQAAHQALLEDRGRLASELLAAGFSDGSVDVSHDSGESNEPATRDHHDESSGAPETWSGSGPSEQRRPVVHNHVRTDSVINLAL